MDFMIRSQSAPNFSCGIRRSGIINCTSSARRHERVHRATFALKIFELSSSLPLVAETKPLFIVSEQNIIATINLFRLNPNRLKISAKFFLLDFACVEFSISLQFKTRNQRIRANNSKGFIDRTSGDYELLHYSNGTTLANFD